MLAITMIFTALISKFESPAPECLCVTDLIFLCKFLYKRHHFKACCGVQAASRLIKEYYFRTGDQLASNAYTAFLATADAFANWGPN